MANCLIWKFAILAIILSSATQDCVAKSVNGSWAILHPDGSYQIPNPIPDVKEFYKLFYGFYRNDLRELLTDSEREVWNTFNAVEHGLVHLKDSFDVHLREFFHKFLSNLGEYRLNVIHFTRAVPAQLYHNLALEILRTALKQTKEQCALFDIKYNPFEKPAPREEFDWVRPGKRETEPKILTKFGQALATWMKSLDDFTANWLNHGLPAYCPIVNQWLEKFIHNVKAMKPDHFKRLVVGCPVKGPGSNCFDCEC